MKPYAKHPKFAPFKIFLSSIFVKPYAKHTKFAPFKIFLSSIFVKTYAKHTNLHHLKFLAIWYVCTSISRGFCAILLCAVLPKI